MSNSSAAAVTHGIEIHYEVETVKKTKAVAGGRGTWYKYVIRGGSAPVTGYREGSLEDVKEYANSLAQEFNARRSPNAPNSFAPTSARGRRRKA